LCRDWSCSVSALKLRCWNGMVLVNAGHTSVYDIIVGKQLVVGRYMLCWYLAVDAVLAELCVGWEVHKRLSYIECHWPYFVGFGLPLAITTSLPTSFIVRLVYVNVHWAVYCLPISTHLHQHFEWIKIL